MAGTLCLLSEPKSILALAAALEDEDRSVCCRAAMALEDMGSAAQSAIPALTKARRNTNRIVGHFAGKALEKIGIGNRDGNSSLEETGRMVIVEGRLLKVQLEMLHSPNYQHPY